MILTFCEIVVVWLGIWPSLFFVDAMDATTKGHGPMTAHGKFLRQAKTGEVWFVLVSAYADDKIAGPFAGIPDELPGTWADLGPDLDGPGWTIVRVVDLQPTEATP
jgi:hypothetical protein